MGQCESPKDLYGVQNKRWVKGRKALRRVLIARRECVPKHPRVRILFLYARQPAQKTCFYCARPNITTKTPSRAFISKRPQWAFAKAARV